MISQFDVQNLNNAISGLGEGFAKRRHDATEEQLRQQMLDVELQRNKAQEAHFTELEKARAAETNQKDDHDTMNKMFMSAANGTIKDYDAVNKALAEHPRFGKIGLQLKAPDKTSGFNTAASWNKQKWDNEQARADELEKQASDFGDGTPEAAALNATAKAIRDNADIFFKPDSAFDTVTEETPSQQEKPEVPAEPPGLVGRMLGQGGTPAVPAVPATPKVIIRRRVPRVTMPTPPTPPPTATGTNAPAMAPATPPPAPVDVRQRQAGQRYTTPKGVFTWTGTGWQQ